MAIKSPNTTPTTRPSTPDTMNTNKAQRTDEDRRGDSPKQEAGSESVKRSASATAPRRRSIQLSKASRERCDVVEEDAANKNSHPPSKKTKNYDDDDDDDDVDDGSSVGASSSLQNIVTVTLPVSVSDISIRTKLLSNHSHPNVDKLGFSNMNAIVTKVRDNAVNYHEIEKAKKPALRHAELFCPTTGKAIMRLPYKSVIAIEKFRELDSFSSTIAGYQLSNRLYAGRNFDGFGIRGVDAPLFYEDIGFVDEEAKLHGRQIAAAYEASIKASSHFTKLRLLRVGMDWTERAEMIGSSKGREYSYLKGLTQDDCDRSNVIIAAIMPLEQDEWRSSSDFLSGPTVLDTQTKLSVDLDDFAVAIVQSGGINQDRVFMISGKPSALRTGRVTINRKPSSGTKKKADLTLLQNDPEQGTELHAVSAATGELVRAELHKLNFVLKLCVNVESIHEQVECIVNMYNAVHKMDKASLVRQVLADLARRSRVQFDEKPISIAVLEFLYKEEELFGKNVAWLLGDDTDNA